MFNFGVMLLKWYKQNKRDLPWRGISDPYKIWLSEIILQQTRVLQGLEYYHRFIDEFPDIHSLARAEDDKVFKMWQGLGYYNRAENLLSAARTISLNLKGKFPENPEELKQIKGIGPYTAAAIASIVFNKPVPVVDGNVFRLLSRMFGVETPINSSKARNEFEFLAQSLMENHPPGEFNQAMMEFGALYCMPKNPDCTNCIFIQHCTAGKNGLTDKFPVKKTNAPIKNIYLFYFFLEIETGSETKIWIQKRKKNSIWKNLYDFPQIEYDASVEPEFAMTEFFGKKNLSNVVLKNISRKYKHQLSHRLIYATFLRLGINENFTAQNKNTLTLINLADLAHYPVSRLVDRYLKDQQIIK